MIVRLVMTIALSILLSGCINQQYLEHHSQPYPIYDAHTVATKDTAVFIALDDKKEFTPDIRIVEVDGQRPGCASWGCPFWVRATPGRHNIKISYTFFLGNLRKTATLEVAVDMKPRHTYIARYDISEGYIMTYIDDLGQDASYSLQLGVDGKRYPVLFK